MGAALAKRAVVLWCQRFMEVYELSPTAAAELRKIATCAAFAADTSGDAMQLSAHAMVSSVVVRQSTWLRMWDVDIATHAKIMVQNTSARI